MRKYHSTLLAGVAALAFAAGISAASAQGEGKDHAGGPPAAQPQATQTTPAGGAAKDAGAPPPGEEHRTGKGPAAAVKQPTGAKPATAATKEGKAPTGQTAQKVTPGNKTNPNGAAANGAGNKTNPNAAAANGEHEPGAAGKTGGNVKLTEQQRTKIRTTIINGGNAPRVSHVNFDVKVGIVVPRESVHVVPVPETLVVIEPEWRGFLYFVYEDEVVIVSPDDMRIVAVLEV
jgi:hypothetical protein